MIPSVIPVVYSVFGHMTTAPADFAKALQNLKSKAKTVDNALKNKSYLVGDQLTLADVIVAVAFVLPF